MNGKSGRIGLWCLIGALGLMAAGGAGSTTWMWLRLRAYEKSRSTAEREAAESPKNETFSWHTVKEGDDIVSIAITYGVAPSKIMEWNDLNPGVTLKAGDRLRVSADMPKPPAGRVAPDVELGRSKTRPSAPPPPKKMSVEKTDYDGDDEIVLRFSERPDMSVLRDYLTVEPMRGALTLRYNGDTGKPRVFVTGDFAYRTNVTLRVRAGCPALPECKAAPLAVDFTCILQRKDAPPRVRLADSGRYLPPGGARMLAVDSINVAKVRCAAAAIPPANIVQLLAREEGRYFGCFGASADSSGSEDLSDKLVEWDVETEARDNEHAVTPLALRTLPDAASNGVFLVAVRSADQARQDDRWWWRDPRGEKWNPNRYRLVCVTDIGLSVRQNDRRLLVWATSLTTGTPVSNCTVQVFGANNRHLATGTTDATGLCDVVCTDRAEPFAVVARSGDGTDTSFVCLGGRQSLDERNLPDGARESYLKPDEVTAFVWTERDIYRHDEKIFLHALLRNGRTEAPKPFPIEFRLLDPEDKEFLRKTAMPDAFGAAWDDSFTVPAERPSGRWRVQARTPGKDGRTLGERAIVIEEFAPPQIRVSVEAEGEQATNFAFRVKAEHLYGGPARGLRSAGAVVFEDAPFAPAAWKGWRFGNDDRGLKPSWRRLWKFNLNDAGEAFYAAPLLAQSGLPKAAVRAVGEGTVFEEGGRPARARANRVVHVYPFYVGTTLGGNVRVPAEGFARTKVACVRSDGTRLPEARKLSVKFERIESVYSCKEDARGWTSWSCDRVRVPMKVPCTELTTRADGDVELEIPFRADGDYALTLTDAETDASFGATFWLGSRGDDEVRAPLANPSEVTLTPDKALYRPGDVPRLLVKAPFAGWALLTVMRDTVISTRTLKLMGPTQEVTLDPVDAAWAPNVDVSFVVVQSAENGGRHQTARAHGLATLKVRRPENEIPVTATTAYTVTPNGGMLTVDIAAQGACTTGAVAVVTVVDEGINLLTERKTPDPVGELSRPRTGNHPLYDLFDNLLPVWDGDPAKVRGVKTGGGAGAEMLGRVSPVPTRRFRPLARWQASVPLTNGAGRISFELQEFVGEVRVTAVAYSVQAVGAGEARQKVTPKLVLRPDAPRFAAPDDAFDVTVTLANRSGGAGACTWKLEAEGPVACSDGSSAVTEKLDKDGAVTRTVRVKADEAPGTARLRFTAEGFGERHVQTIELPVRPAVASRETSGTVMLAPGESRTFAVASDGVVPEAAVRQFTPSGTSLAQLVGALEFLAEYPHGCLEQTSSRMFPLVTAGGFLNTLANAGYTGRAATNRAAIVEAGVKRVCSMIRMHDFVMWPDCTYAPWDREVSLYAAHFLVEAERSGVKLPPIAKERVLSFLDRWSRDSDKGVSAYACHTLALANAAAFDRMLMLFDRRTELDPLACARLSRAFALAGDRRRAADLLGAEVSQPSSVKAGAFLVLALLELDPADVRLAPLVRYLEASREPSRFSWGTTGENAHALLALGAYYRHRPVQEGRARLVWTDAQGRATELKENHRETVVGAEAVTISNRGTGAAWLTWRSIDLPRPNAVTNEAAGITLTRSFWTPDGKPADLSKIARGDLLIADIELSSPVRHVFSDLVIQDLFPAAFEPVHGGLDADVYDWIEPEAHDWVMRSDARDDRMLVFSRKFEMRAGGRVHFRYPVRVVTGGDFTLPGASVEAMYAPAIHARTAPTRISGL